MEENQFIIEISFDPMLNENQKVNLPVDYLQVLVDNDEEFPVFFQIKNGNTMFYTSVHEFSAPNDTIQIPYVIANELDMHNADIVELTLVQNVLKCKDLQIEPLSENFFSMDNSDEFLEKNLSKLSILYLNQIFYLMDDETTYRFKVTKIEPDFESINFSEFHTENQNCFCIIDQDINVDIVNKFEMDRYYEKKRKERHETLIQKSEFDKMRKEDMNILKLGEKLDPNVNTKQLTSDEIRRRRLEKYKYPLNQKKKNEFQS